jgi:hypothetical protein
MDGLVQSGVVKAGVTLEDRPGEWIALAEEFG